jgi:putative photosynthetic complex assembly protein 2
MSTFLPYLLTALATLFVWWFSTGVIVYLDGLRKRTYIWSFAVTSLLAIAALIGISFSAASATINGVIIAFGCAIVVWGWNEMGFLMGFITGPRPEACPPGAKGFDRFSYATMAILYHELALAVSLGVIAMLTAGEPNQFGFWTFGLLWVMRLSAKLNLFFGVPNRTEEFLPDGLTYLKSYFRSASMNAFLPVAITAATIGCVLLVQRVSAVPAGTFEATGFTLLATLLALALLEHWMMIVPIPAALLWGWGLKSHEATARSRDGTTGTLPLNDAAGFAKQVKPVRV